MEWFSWVPGWLPGFLGGVAFALVLADALKVFLHAQARLLEARIGEVRAHAALLEAQTDEVILRTSKEVPA